MDPKKEAGLTSRYQSGLFLHLEDDELHAAVVLAALGGLVAHASLSGTVGA
jgi:hypothetical protein